MTAFALLLILEGLLPMIAPQAWQRAMQELSKGNPQIIRVVGIICMLTGAVWLQFLN